MSTSTTPGPVPSPTGADTEVTELDVTRADGAGVRPVWTVPSDAYWTKWSQVQRDAVKAWLVAHDLNPDLIPANKGDVLTIVDTHDGPALHTWRYVRGEGGGILACPNCPNCPKCEQVTVPLVADPPTLAGEYPREPLGLSPAGQALLDRLRARREADHG